MSDWKLTRDEDPGFKCKCGSNDVAYRTVDDDQGHEDYNYRCNACQRNWWVDGIDS